MVASAKKRMVASAKKMYAFGKVFVQLVGALVFAPVLVALFGLVLLLGLFPIPQIRTAILAAQSKLTATVGDSFAFVESPVRAGLIRTGILNSLERLKWLEPLKGGMQDDAPGTARPERLKELEQRKPRCKHTVIVAHSQGAAVVLEALGGMSKPGEKGEPEASSHVVPDALVTFGAGTNELASQKYLSAGLTKPIAENLVRGAIGIGVSLGAVGVLLWLYLSVHLYQTSLEDIGRAFLVLFLGWAGFMVIAWPISSLLLRRGAAERARNIGLVLSVLLSLIMGGLMIWYTEHSQLPIMPLYMLLERVPKRRNRGDSKRGES